MNNINNNATSVRKDEIPQEILKPHEQAMNEVLSSVPDTRVNGLRYFRRFLSKPSISNFDIATVLAMNILDVLKPLLLEGEADQFPEQTFEALWIVTNLAAGNSEHCRTILESGMVDLLVNLLDVVKYQMEVVDQCIWAFGNIVGDGSLARDMVLYETAVLQKILPLARSDNFSIRRNVAWTISNFFRFKPRPSVDMAKAVIPVVVEALQHETDEEALVDLCWAVSYLSEDNDTGYPRIQALLDMEVAPLLVQHLQSPQQRLRVPCLRSLGNLITGTDTQTDIVLASGLIPAMYPLLSTSNVNMRKEVCWIVSNVMAGTTSQKMMIIGPECPVKFLDALVQLLETDASDVCKEIWWVIANGSMGKEIPKELLIPEKTVPALSRSIDRFPTNSKISIAVIGLVQLLCYENKDHLRVDKNLAFLMPELNAEGTLGRARSFVQEKVREIEVSRDNVCKSMVPLQMPDDVNWLVASMIHTVE